MKRTGAWHAGGNSRAIACSISGAQAEQARLGRHELVFQLGAPGRMGEIAGPDHADALAGGPCGQMFEIEIAAGRARIFRVDVQVGVKAHCGHARMRPDAAAHHLTPRADSLEKRLWTARA